MVAHTCRAAGCTESAESSMRPWLAAWPVCRAAVHAVNLAYVPVQLYMPSAAVCVSDGAGPAHPYQKDGLAAGLKNHRAGHVEVSV